MLGKLTNEEIETVLKTNIIGRIGCHADQQLYVVPISYFYDGEFIIGHTIEGMKIELLRKNPECCVEVDEITSLSDWRSVIVWGTYEELSGERAEKAQTDLLNRILPLMETEEEQPGRMGLSSSHREATQTNNPIVYRIRLNKKTGRFESP